MVLTRMMSTDGREEKEEGSHQEILGGKAACSWVVLGFLLHRGPKFR